MRRVNPNDTYRVDTHLFDFGPGNLRHNSLQQTHEKITFCTEIPTIIDPSTIVNYPGATGSTTVGISVQAMRTRRNLYICTCKRISIHTLYKRYYFVTNTRSNNFLYSRCAPGTIGFNKHTQK